MYSSIFTYSGPEVEAQKTASKQKKKVERQEIQSKSDFEQTEKVSINHNIAIGSNNTPRDDCKEAPDDDVTLSVYSPKDGLMTSIRVSSILKNTNEGRNHFSRRTDEEKTSMITLSNQMYYNRPSYTNSDRVVGRSFLEPMLDINSRHGISIQGNPNFLPLAGIPETQEELYRPIQTYRRSRSNDIHRFTGSVESGFPTLNSIFNSKP